jgi:hypothetical protein
MTVTARTMHIDTQAIRSGYDRKTCWVHARPGVIPGETPIGIITMHALRLTGDDVFYPICDMRSDDGGKTWTQPTSHGEAFARRPAENGMEDGISDVSLMWHEKSGTLLGTGHTVRYINDNLAPLPRMRKTTYTTYDPDGRAWSKWRMLEVPDEPKFFCEGAGSTQRLDLPNGDILLPTYYAVPGSTSGVFEFQGVSMVMRCTFDGETMRYVEHGTELTIATGRGMCEPSIAYAAGRYFLTIRNNDHGYVAVSKDGLQYGEPKRWTFDDGKDLGNYNTQQHWVSQGDELYLIYTRRGANNDHVVRHRAPLFIAQVDTDRVCVMRETEQILVPERGARLGNFGVARYSDSEVWVVVSEWMQTKEPDPFDCTVCEKYGSDNSIFLARLRWDQGGS